MYMKISRKEAPQIVIKSVERPNMEITRRLGSGESWDSIPVIDTEREEFIRTKKDIAKLVELPLLKACEIFWDKNIETASAHANPQALIEGKCWLRLKFVSLSEENKKIALTLGTIHKDMGNDILEIVMDVNELTSPQEVESWFVDKASQFKKQPAIWIHPVSKDETIEYQRQKHGSAAGKFAEELNAPGGWEAFCERSNYFIDESTGLAYPSEELFKKATEKIE